MNNDLKKIQKRIKINFLNIELLNRSLIHKSSNKKYNNEKLEFLGDRVIGLVISKKLVSLYPDETEGVIDKKFASLVNKKTCAKIANILDLKKFIRTGNSYKNINSSDEKILSDACEALIGAIYLDQGFNTSEKFILKNWESFIKKSNLVQVDAKTKLQEYSLKKSKELPNYKIYRQIGPNHNPTFKVQVQIRNSKKYVGYGKSKKLAQQNAASNLLKSLKID
jgi:ribonuclease-3